MRLPQEVLVQLEEAARALLQPGDLYFLPAARVVYRGDPKDRPCLVVVLEGSGRFARAHLVPGTSRRASGPALVVSRDDETDLLIRTEFDFSASFALPVSVVLGEGRFKGRLATERLSEIDLAVANSNRVALKRLMGR